MNSSIAGLALLAFSAPAPAPAAGGAWIDDFDRAVELAKKEGKDLLVDFTGSDWCGWCIRLHDEVFGHEEFTTAAQKSFVLVALDFPNKEENKAKVPNPERNAALRDKYEIRGFPTVLAMNPAGEVFASTGYRPGGVEDYLLHLEEVSTAGRKALTETKALLAAFEAAQGEEKLAQWEKALAMLESLGDDSPFRAQVAGPVRWAFTADPNNERGLKLRALKALLAAGQVDEATIAVGKELDPKNEHGILEQLVENQFMTVGDDEGAQAALAALEALTPFGFRDSEVGFRLTFTAARWCAGPLQKPELAKKFAQAARDIGTEDEGALAMLDEMIGE